MHRCMLLVVLVASTYALVPLNVTILTPPYKEIIALAYYKASNHRYDVVTAFWPNFKQYCGIYIHGAAPQSLYLKFTGVARWRGGSLRLGLRQDELYSTDCFNVSGKVLIHAKFVN